MSVLRLVMGVLLGLAAITLVAESVEFITVKLVSGKGFSELTTDESGYFDYRNSTSILLFKILYSFLAGAAGGILTTRIATEKTQLALYLLISIQILSLIWGGFFSDLSTTGPVWMWIYLIFIIPLGIYSGYKIHEKKKAQR